MVIKNASSAGRSPASICSPLFLSTKLNTKCKFALLPMMFPYLVISEWEFRDETFPSCSQPASETPFSSY